MANFLDSFVEAGRGADYRKLDDLQQNISYKVLRFEMKTTQFGNGLQGEIEDPSTLESFTMFFPERLAKKINSEEELKLLNDEQFSFIFKGREKRVAILEFFKS